LATRMPFVVKIECFSPQNGDENWPRRQKMKFPDQKRWREQASSPKMSIPRPKMAMRQRGGSQPPPSQIRKISKIHFPLFIISVKIKFAWLFSWPLLLRWNG
jgi:hypothetical protein